MILFIVYIYIYHHDDHHLLPLQVRVDLGADCFVSYPGLSLGGGSYSSAEMQPVYSIAPAAWAINS